MERKRDKLTKFIEKNSEFKIVDDELMCSLCAKIIKYSKKRGLDSLKKHLKTKNHMLNLKILTSKQSILTLKPTESDSKKIFIKELINAFVGAGLPINSLNNNGLSTFLTKWTQMKIPDESTLRKNYLSKISDEKITIIRKKISDSYYLILDESMDSNGRSLLNILIGSLDGKMNTSFLIGVKELKCADSENVVSETMRCLDWFFQSKVVYENFLLLVTDQASYMIKAGTIFKSIFNNLKHVTCIVHALHRCCEAFKENNKKLDEFVNKIKKSLRKNKKNRKIFVEATNLQIPKLPIVTRWGSWIHFAIFISKNYTKIMNYVKKLSKESESKIMMLELLETTEVKSSLFEILSFEFLLAIIKKLETKNLMLEEQIEILNSVKINGNELIKKKLKDSLEKNPDIGVFTNFKEIPPDLRNKFKYAKLTSVDVERSFSALGHIFSEKRRSLSVSNLNYMLIIYFNKDL